VDSPEEVWHTVPGTLIDIVKSFHDGKETRIQLDQGLAEEIKVNSKAVVWHQHLCVCCYGAMVGTEGVGVHMQLKFDKQLFRNSTRGAYHTYFTGQFADDVVLFVVTREAAEQATRLYQGIAKSLRLTVSIIKTKFMM